MGDISTAPAAFLIAVAILGNGLAALLSAGEAALLRLTRHGAANLIEDRPRIKPRLEMLLDDPSRTAAAVALTRLVVEIVAATCLTIALAALFSPWLTVLGGSIAAAVIISVVVVRISPRTWGRQHPERVLAAISGLLAVVYRLARGVTVATKARVADDSDDRDLQEMVDRVNESDAIEEGERDMIRSVFELSTTLTREVMVPRTEMVTISADVSLHKAISLFLRSGFSRVPVTGESTDDLLGVLYFKDVVRVLEGSTLGAGSQPRADRAVSEVMRDPSFVPESKPVDELLREFQNRSSHLALVVDEYGGIAGLVTVEDALEEIVGELTDEHDQAAPEVEALPNGDFRVPARLPIDELGDLFGIALDDDDVDSVGGLLAKLLGRVPLPGAVAEISGIRLEAERVEGRRHVLSTVVAHSISDVAETVSDSEYVIGHNEHYKEPQLTHDD